MIVPGLELSPHYNSKRLPNWQERLVNYLEDCRAHDHPVEFSWAAFTCAKFVGGAIQAVRGDNPHLDFDGQYSTPEEAAKALKDRGFKDLMEFARAQAPEIPKLAATYGDIVSLTVAEEDASVPKEVRFTLGVAEPPFYWVVTPAGLGRGRLYSKSVISAFGIGHGF